MDAAMEDDYVLQDEVVKEMPVFLSSQLLNHLYLFQYPVRTRPFTSDSQPIAARIKPGAQLIELDTPLQTQAYTYDKEKGEHFGFALSDEQMKTVYDVNQQFEVDRARQTTLLDKQTLRSNVVPPKTNYMVAVIRDDELHLTPVAGTVQLRPSLDYLDSIDEKQKLATKKVLEEEKRARGEIGDKKPMQQLQLARLETEEMIEARKKSITYQRKQVSDEPWTKLDFFEETSEEADIIFHRLFSRHRDHLRYTCTSESYLEDISPPSVIDVKRPENSEEKPDIRPGVLSRQDLKIFDLETQLRAVLTNAHILPFERIMMTLPSLTSAVDILNHLTKVAIPLHGNWVVRSSLLYTGRRCHARDYLIKMFHDSVHRPPSIIRSDFTKVAMLPWEDTKRLFEELAILTCEAGESSRWVLKYPVGDEFNLMYGDLISKTWSQFVAEDIQRAMEELELVPRRLTLNDITKKSKIAKPIPSVPKTTVNPLQSPMPTTTVSAKKTLVEQIDSAITTLLRQQGVIQTTALMTHVLSTIPDGNEENITTRAHNLCHEVHGAFVLKKLNNKQDDIRDVVLDLYRHSMEGSVKKNDILRTAKQRLGRDIPVKAFNEIVAELSRSAKSPYIWKSSPSIADRERHAE